MDYLFSITKFLNQEKENCWLYKQRTADLSEETGHIRGIWDDEASKNLWNRFVYPFDDDAAVLSDFKEQFIENTDEIIKNSKIVFDNTLSVARLSEDINMLLKDADREHTTSATCSDKAGQYIDKIQETAPSIDAEYESIKNVEQKFKSLYSKKQRIYTIF